MPKAIVVLMVVLLSTCSRPPGILEEVLETGQLRVITRIGPTTFYTGATGHEGPEHDLVQGFREHLELKYDRPVEVEFVVAGSLDDLLHSVAIGRAHFAAAAVTPTPERRQRVNFGPGYKEVHQHLIYRLNDGRPQSLDDVIGKRLEVLADSRYVETLAAWRSEHPELVWTETRRTSVSELLRAVQDEELDYTVVDSLDYEVHRFFLPDLRRGLSLKTGDSLAWAFNRHRSDDLHAEVEEYFARINTDGTLARINERYFGHTERFDYVSVRAFSRHVATRLPRYRAHFEAAAAETGVDWRLLAAIGYQESLWDSSAISPTGVRGLMMLTNATATAYGVMDRTDPVASIKAGSQYFAYLYSRFQHIPEPDRTWFALAAYNVGYGHVLDARKLARREGLDPDSWLALREMLPRLTDKAYYSTVRHGYARGWEPVHYVNNVRTYYEIMNWLTVVEAGESAPPALPQPRSEPDRQIASRSPPSPATT